jgi:hypothetical protein
MMPTGRDVESALRHGVCTGRNRAGASLLLLFGSMSPV